MQATTEGQKGPGKEHEAEHKHRHRPINGIILKRVNIFRRKKWVQGNGHGLFSIDLGPLPKALPEPGISALPFHAVV